MASYIALDLYGIVDELVRHIREFRPQVMLTFRPRKARVTGHTDHSMVSVFATAGVHVGPRATTAILIN